jgi:PAS domain S-box-containing protein
MSTLQNSTEKIRVLHVDDDIYHLSFSKKIIEKIDPFIILESIDSQQKAESIYEQYDCILSDYKMPGKTGIQLAESIRRKSSVPFILYTGQGSEEVAETAFLVGIDDYIRKEMEPAHYRVVARRIRMAVERYRAIKELKRSEQSLAKAQEIAHLGNWDWHISVNKLYWSDEIYRIFGLKPKEFGATYEAFLNTVHPDDRDYVISAVDEALHNDKSYSIDHRIVLPSGEIRFVHEQAEVHFESSKAVRMIGTVQDISERKMMEAQLVESETRFREIAENSIDVIFTLDLNGIITYISPAIEAILEEHADDVVGHRFLDFMPEWNHPKAQSQFMNMLYIERVEDAEFDVVGKDGSKCTVEIKAFPVFKEGVVLRIQGLLRDVTERKHLREEIRRLNELLSDRVEASIFSEPITEDVIEPTY